MSCRAGGCRLLSSPGRSFLWCAKCARCRRAVPMDACIAQFRNKYQILGFRAATDFAGGGIPNTISLPGLASATALAKPDGSLPKRSKARSPIVRLERTAQQFHVREMSRMVRISGSKLSKRLRPRGGKILAVAIIKRVKCPTTLSGRLVPGTNNGKSRDNTRILKVIYKKP